MRHQVNCPFCDISCLRATRSAIGIGGSLICEDDISAKMYRRNVIGPTRNRESKGDHNHIGEYLTICTQIRNAMHLQSCYFAFFGSCDLHIIDLVPTMDGNREILTSVFNPFDWMT